MCTHNKISHLKVLHRKRLDGLGALASAWCIRALSLHPITFLLLWLRNKVCFANVVGTKTTRFSNKLNDKKSHLKGFHKTTPHESGAQALT